MDTHMNMVILAPKCREIFSKFERLFFSIRCAAMIRCAFDRSRLWLSFEIFLKPFEQFLDPQRLTKSIIFMKIMSS